MTATTLPIDAGRDARFFRVCITIMALALVSGFVSNIALGRSSFNAPLVVHAHAFVFMGWVFVVVGQMWLAASGAISFHRLVGWGAVCYAALLLVLGPLVTIAAVQDGRTPFFFQPQHFLFADPATVLAAMGLFGAAIVLRKQTDWHARLQIGAFLPLLGPGVGRLLPLPLLMPYAFEIAALIALIVPLVGMARDRKVHGRAHPAWFWSAAVLVLALVGARMIAFSPVGDVAFAAVVAGTSLEGVDGRAFPPPPGAAP